MQSKYDVIIAGGGMVGMSAALALARLGLSVAVVEKTALPKQLEANFDGRVSALALGSVFLLQDIGAWQAMQPYAEAIYDIRVSDGKTNFFVHYNHQEVSAEPFGYIVENRYIRSSLQQAVNECRNNGENIEIIEQAEISSFQADNYGAEICLNNGRILRSLLVIAADGKYSALREMAGIRTISCDYKQTAIVCTIAHEKPHNGLAQERFLPAGAFAVLPMTQQRSSLVWVEPQERAQLYLDLPEDECEQEISERVGSYLGAINLLGKRFSYPLSLMYARNYVATRLALIGDAAHGIHPIAGQGVNLGFRDVAALQELIRKQSAIGLDIGTSSLLAEYQRKRRFDNITMIGVTDGLNRLFCSDLMPLKIARGIGLWTVNKTPPLKRFFMKQAMGI